MSAAIKHFLKNFINYPQNYLDLTTAKGEIILDEIDYNLFGVDSIEEIEYDIDFLSYALFDNKINYTYYSWETDEKERIEKIKETFDKTVRNETENKIRQIVEIEKQIEENNKLIAIIEEENKKLKEEERLRKEEERRKEEPEEPIIKIKPVILGDCAYCKKFFKNLDKHYNNNRICSKKHYKN